MKSVSTEQLCQTFSPEYFRELSSFGAISDETVLKLLRDGNVFHLEPDEVLYHAGEKVQAFYIILRGKIALYYHYQAKPALARSYGAGEQIGFVGMIALHDRKGTAIVEETSLVLEVKTEQFFDLHLSDPQDFGLLVLNLSREMARTVGRLGDLVARLKAQGPVIDEH
ncbi:MAG: cyclic nucleotide-binding domain-containing protein [Pontibacterium sp.]